ncbi:hypothetical protein Pcinc_041848 [Petrolisthes cinctipes]|uniref:Uncharacterized protein n=1 Tax=Petrolisthes cinctipes TaxID=88211 RepID=A0AAE1BJX4_PETCI|nr:hypothetical protein Pcinc_041848 [Petrolisthes cinctipes]
MLTDFLKLMLRGERTGGTNNNTGGGGGSHSTGSSSIDGGGVVVGDVDPNTNNTSNNNNNNNNMALPPHRFHLPHVKLHHHHGHNSIKGRAKRLVYRGTAGNANISNASTSHSFFSSSRSSSSSSSAASSSASSSHYRRRSGKRKGREEGRGKVEGRREASFPQAIREIDDIEVQYTLPSCPHHPTSPLTIITTTIITLSPPLTSHHPLPSPQRSPSSLTTTITLSPHHNDHPHPSPPSSPSSTPLTTIIILLHTPHHHLHSLPSPPQSPSPLTTTITTITTILLHTHHHPLPSPPQPSPPSSPRYLSYNSVTIRPVLTAVNVLVFAMTPPSSLPSTYSPLPITPTPAPAPRSNPDPSNDSLGAGSHHSSKVSLLEGRHQVVDHEPVAGVVPLSHQAALHKIAVRPRRTHGAPRSRRTTQIGGQISLPDVIEEANNRNLNSQKLLSTSVTSSTATFTTTTATSSITTTTAVTTSTPVSGPLLHTQDEEEVQKREAEEGRRKEAEEAQRRETEESEKEEKREEPLFQRLFGSSNKRSGRRTSRGRGEDSRENSVSPLRRGGEQRTSREGKRRDSSGSRFPGGAVSKNRQDPPHPLPPSGRPREASRERSSSGTGLGVLEVNSTPGLSSINPTTSPVVEVTTRPGNSEDRHAPRPVSYPSRPAATAVRKVKSFKEVVGSPPREPMRPRAPSQTDAVEMEDILPRSAQAARLSASLESMDGGEGVRRPHPHPKQAPQDPPPPSPQRSSTESLATTLLPGVFIRPHPTTRSTLIPQLQDSPFSCQDSGPFSLDSSVGAGHGKAEAELRKAASVDHMGTNVELAPVHRRQRIAPETRVLVVEGKAERKTERKVDVARLEKMEDRRGEIEAAERRQDSAKLEKRSESVKAEKKAEKKAERKQENLKAEKKQESMKVEKRQEYVKGDKKAEVVKMEKTEIVKIEKKSEYMKIESMKETVEKTETVVGEGRIMSVEGKSVTLGEGRSMSSEGRSLSGGEGRRASVQLQRPVSGFRGEDISRADSLEVGDGDMGATPPRRPLRKEPSLKRSAPPRDSDEDPVPEFMRIQLNRVESKGQAVIYDTEQERGGKREAQPPATQPVTQTPTQPLHHRRESTVIEPETERKEEQNANSAASKTPIQLTKKSSFQGLRGLLRDGLVSGGTSESESGSESAAEMPGDRVQLRKPLVAEKITTGSGGNQTPPPPRSTRDQPELFKVFARRSFKVKDSDRDKLETEEEEEDNEGHLEASGEVSEVTVTPARAPVSPIIPVSVSHPPQEIMQKSSINTISYNRKSVGNPALSFIPPSINSGSPLTGKPMVLLPSTTTGSSTTITTTTSPSTSTPSLPSVVSGSCVGRSTTTVTSVMDTPKRPIRTPSPATDTSGPGEIVSRIISNRLNDQSGNISVSETSSGTSSPAQVRTTQPSSAHTRPPLTSRPSASLIWPPRPQQEQQTDQELPEVQQKSKVTPVKESEGVKELEKEVHSSPHDILAARRRFMRSVSGGAGISSDGGHISSTRENQEVVVSPSPSPTPSPTPVSSTTATPPPTSTSPITSSILSRAAVSSIPPAATSMPLFTVTLRTQPPPPTATPVQSEAPSASMMTSNGEQGMPEKVGEAAEDWRVLVRQRREGRLKQTKTPDAEEIIIETRPTVSRNSKVLEMASNFQKLQVA